MSQVYQWCIEHPWLIGAIASAICLAVPNTAFVKAGFFVSQFIRKIAGKKLEKKVEDLADGFVKGLKGDNENER